MSFAEAIWPILAAAALGALVFAALTRVLHDARRAALVTSIGMVLFLSFGHMWSAVEHRQIGSVNIDREIYLFPFWVAIIAGAVLFALRARRSLPETTFVMNGIAMTLVLTNVWTLATQSEPPPVPEPSIPSLREPQGEPRDVYYLIFDRYGSERTLRDFFGFDNSPFLRDLERRGFTVIEDARANYPKTPHSLASSLRTEHLLDLTSQLGPDSADWRGVFRYLERPLVARALQRIGYGYVHLGSWWGPTRTSPIADLNHEYEAPPDFWNLVYRTSTIYPIAVPFGLDLRAVEWRRVQYQFDKLAESHRLKGPNFVFAHFLLPHDPFVFRPDGTFIEDEDSLSKNDAYIGQLQYTNRKIGALLDTLLAGPDDEDPIIILQSDEGPHPPRLELDEHGFDWTRATPFELRTKLTILNALYLPGEPADIPATITPVNTFRIVFNRYFGTDLPLLPDETYVFRDESHLYSYTNVTARLSAP